MMSTQTQPMTPLRIAQQALTEADVEIAKIEQENAPLEEKSARFVEQIDDARLAGGADCRESLRAAAGMNALAEKLRAGRQRLEQVQRRRTVAAARVESELRAVTIARQAVRNQQQRVANQAEALATARRLVREKEVALDTEERTLRQLRAELQALTGDEDDTKGEQ